jgi:hypothetical protein
MNPYRSMQEAPELETEVQRVVPLEPATVPRLRSERQGWKQVELNLTSRPLRSPPAPGLLADALPPEELPMALEQK